ncbi:MAG: LacI family DNA-binding transcriptional regulator [Phycisphaerae bacterium]
MRPTLHSIAERVGVSDMAVSLALRGKGRISPDVRQRIIEVAAELGYRPNTAARAMTSGRLGCVALLLSTSKQVSNLPHLMLDGIDDGLQSLDYHLSVAHLRDEQLVDPKRFPKLLRELLADGVLINYHFRVPQGLIDTIDRQKIPSVWINRKQPHDAVRPDDEAAGRILTEHLLAVGHRRIAYVDLSHVAEQPDEHYSAADRLQGYRSAMQSAGLPPRVVHRLPEGVEASFRRCIDLLREPNRPTALVCYSGSTATTASLAAARVGIDVPTDLSITMIEDRPLTVGKPITLAALPMNAVGRQASEMLLEKIRSPERRPTVVVPPTLRPGGTVAPAGS